MPEVNALAPPHGRAATTSSRARAPPRSASPSRSRRSRPRPGSAAPSCRRIRARRAAAAGSLKKLSRDTIALLNARREPRRRPRLRLHPARRRDAPGRRHVARAARRRGDAPRPRRAGARAERDRRARAGVLRPGHQRAPGDGAPAPGRRGRARAPRCARAIVHDDPSQPPPTLAGVAGSEATHVGRIRDDTALEHGLALWIALDSVRKGAALNAVEIAEILFA